MQATQFADKDIEEAFEALNEGRMFTSEVEGYGGLKRMVIVPLLDTKELMIAVESGGCVFMSADTRHNRFVFVQHGFQLLHGMAIEQLLNGVLDLVDAKKAATEPLQIEDQSTPQE